MNLAFNADCSFISSDRWIASLSDGSTVFEDHRPGQPSAWQRLKSYLLEQSLHITKLRLQVDGQLVQIPSFKDSNGIPQLSGYWQARRITRTSFGQEINEHGIGYIKDGILYIKWIRLNDGAVLDEQRTFSKARDLAAILYE